jgi:hypothetical protein
MNVLTARTVDGRTLVSDQMFARLTARIAADHPELAPDLPTRIMDQALAFLAACAVSTEPLGPSDLVDIGWHTFILYTHDYAEFCGHLAGRFIHHEPDEGYSGGGPASGVPLRNAVAAIKAAGYTVDEALWRSAKADCSSSKCTQCHAGCHDSP